MLIAGPTASGKSALAVRLAQALIARGGRAAVVNSDASQIYRDIPILTAQPTAAERDGIAHHLFGDTDASIAGSAAAWAARANAVIASLSDRVTLPILVGGTGLYFRTLLDGIAPVPPIDPDVRDAVRALPQAHAYAALRVEDREAAERLAPNDRTRVCRALEVVRSTGSPLADWQRQRSGGIAAGVALHPIVLTPSREWLRVRVRERLERMVERGALEEAAKLAARGLDPALPAMRAIGVPEFIVASRDEATVAEAAEATALATGRYIKRQDTWFRHQPPRDWPRIADLDQAAHAVDALAAKLVDLASSAS